MDYKQKYLKYKRKYLMLKKEGGYMSKWYQNNVEMRDDRENKDIKSYPTDNSFYWKLTENQYNQFIKKNPKLVLPYLYVDGVVSKSYYIPENQNVSFIQPTPQIAQWNPQTRKLSI